MIAEIIEQMNKHNEILTIYACKDKEAIYFNNNTEDIRTAFFRDIDRIIYSLAYIRYQDKTQVFSYTNNDHIQRRMLHVQLVSKIARTIGRALGLNEDLIEAASLAHDLGHPPFGHEGEKILNKISLKNNQGYFNHNIQSVRVLMFLENFGQGLNVSVQVLDAVMCHNGEFILGKYEPCLKTKEKFLEDYYEAYSNKDIIKQFRPMTLEGCVVRISDMIAYLGRDIDDAVRLNKFNRKDLPLKIVEVLGNNTKDIVNNCIQDVINNSFKKNYIQISSKVYEAIKDLKAFNYQHIYNYSDSAQDKDILEHKFTVLYETYIKDIKTNNEVSPIINSYLNKMGSKYKEENSIERIVIDYIAGMTDDYFLAEYARIKKI